MVTMPHDVIPHDSWAGVYDLAYEASFGRFYTELTEATLAVVNSYVSPPAAIVDFGAGTGRLALPLSRQGYEVTAVDASQKMLDQLAAKDLHNSISRTAALISNFRGIERFDLALCVFTVISYLLDEGALQSSFQRMYESLKPGGYLILDVPSKAVFHGYSSMEGDLARRVEVTESSSDLYSYSERIDFGETTFRDDFAIRYWELTAVMKVASDTGFTLEKDLSRAFTGAGARYFVLRKTN